MSYHVDSYLPKFMFLVLATPGFRKVEACPVLPHPEDPFRRFRGSHLGLDPGLYFFGRWSAAVWRGFQKAADNLAVLCIFNAHDASFADRWVGNASIFDFR